MNDIAAVPAVRILVIEDSSADVFLLKRALKKQDLCFELIHLPGGVEAFACIRRQGVFAEAATPDLILVDLNLSKYSGEEILREIQGARHLRGIPVCLWSSSRPPREEALQDLGVTRFINKPSGLEQFMQIGRTIRDLLLGHTGECRQ